MFKTCMSLALAWALAVCQPAFAQEADLARMREEMKQLQKSYEERMQALEKRLSDAEARANATDRSAARPDTAGTATSGRTGESAFNPGITLILQGTWARTSQDPNNFQITGFVPTRGEVAPPKRSFGLGESELAISANIDPYFRGAIVAALTPENEVAVEEAYFQTLALPRGFTLKAGRFLSGIGYQNDIHRHAWDFQDAPLPYKAFLGGRFRHDGAQLRWIAPTELFMELGGEVGSGEAFPGSDQNKNGAGSWALFSHIGGDIGTSYAWRAGVSYLRASSRNRAYEDLNAAGAPVMNAFTGTSRAWIVDGVLKWAPNGDASRTNVKLQAEYFRMRQDGTLTFDQAGVNLSDYFSGSQSGWYAQAVWQFMPRWRVGYRYDRLRAGDVQIGVVANGLGPIAADFPVLTPHNPSLNAGMLDFSPTEFSRLRLQLASDKSRLGATDKQIILQYIHSLGAHGAHRF